MISTIKELAEQILDKTADEISELETEHGIIITIAQEKTNVGTPQCPQGYIWNGSACVADVG